MTDEELEAKTDPPLADLTNEDKRELSIQEMRKNLYATVFTNCPGKADEKTKHATEALKAFDRVEK